jgi:23S rRNA (guanosine2251-2'-O)-methyltransferase
MVPNVNRMLNDLKKKGFFVYGLDAKGDTVLAQEDFRKASVIVLGNEGDGLRAKTREACDVLLTIPMHPQCESLNASVSAALVLYAWSQRHPASLAE